jgi:hypothetical protein
VTRNSSAEIQFQLSPVFVHLRYFEGKSQLGCHHVRDFSDPTRHSGTIGSKQLDIKKFCFSFFSSYMLI